MAVSEPTLEPLKVDGPRAFWPTVWATWCSQVWRCLQGWTKTYYAEESFNFGSIPAQDELVRTITITGVRVGDMVLARPTTPVSGVAMDGTVTADDTVTLRAFNYSAAPVNPATQVYCVLVFSQ